MVTVFRRLIKSESVKAIIDERLKTEGRVRSSNPDYDRTTDFNKKGAYTNEDYTHISRYGLHAEAPRPPRNVTYTTAVVHSVAVVTHYAAERAGDVLESEWADALVERQPSSEGRTHFDVVHVGFYPKEQSGIKQSVALAANVDGFKCPLVALGFNIFTYCFL